MITLKRILQTQDMGDSTVDKICDGLLTDCHATDRADHITMVIVDAFLNNQDDLSQDGFVQDLDYAIWSLQKARNMVYNNS